MRILLYPICQEIQLNDSNEISSHQLADTNKWNNKKLEWPNINQRKNMRNRNTKLITERFLKSRNQVSTRVYPTDPGSPPPPSSPSVIRSPPLAPGRRFPVIIVNAHFHFHLKIVIHHIDIFKLHKNIINQPFTIPSYSLVNGPETASVV